MEKKELIIEMINSISSQKALDYIYVFVKDAYQVSCYESKQEPYLVERNST